MSIEILHKYSTWPNFQPIYLREHIEIDIYNSFIDKTA